MLSFYLRDSISVQMLPTVCRGTEPTVGVVSAIKWKKCTGLKPTWKTSTTATFTAAHSRLSLIFSLSSSFYFHSCCYTHCLVPCCMFFLLSSHTPSDWPCWMVSNYSSVKEVVKRCLRCYHSRKSLLSSGSTGVKFS